MKRYSLLFLIMIILFGLLPHERVYSQEENTFLDYLKTLTPELVLQRANEDMKELYGLKNYYPVKTNNGSFNAALVQKQINDAIKNPENFSGFDIVYGTSHGTSIVHHGQHLTRYSGYNKFGDPVSTDGFPWDAGWSGVQIHNFPLIPSPRVDNVDDYKFDDFPSNFTGQITDKFKELNPKLHFEQQILTALNKKYAGVRYGDYLMYNKQNFHYKDRKVYYKNGAPTGGWIKYVHVIQPPTYLSQGFGRVYLESNTYMDVPIASFATTKGSDISAEFDDLPTSAAAGDRVEVSVLVDSTFPKEVSPAYSWVLTRVSDDRSLTKETDQLEFSGNAGVASASGTISIDPGGKRRLGAAFTMPESAVRIQFKVNEKGDVPKETILSNNVLDSHPRAIKVAEPQSYPYDMLTKKVRLPLPENTVTLQLPDLDDAAWDGNATGSLNVYNKTEDLLRDFKILNNPPVNEDSETISRSPVVTYTILRKDFGIDGKNDDPENRKYVNLESPGNPLRRTGQIFYDGSVSRKYTYTTYENKCTGEGEAQECESVPKKSSGTVTESFNSDTVTKPYEMYVYNGREVVPKFKYRDEIEENQPDSLTKNLFWTNEPYYYSVIRWMHHQDEAGEEYGWTKVPGQYEREFIQQASGYVKSTKTRTMEEEYSQSRKAAASRTNKKSLYDKAVFATDKDLQKYAYPIKSGYYFNPAGSYTFTLNTVVFKDKKPAEGTMTNDHKDLLDALVNSFRYESDIMYINNKKQAVNIHNEGLAPKGGGFERKTGVLSVQDSKGVNGEKLIRVLDRSEDKSRFDQKVEEIEHTDVRGEDSHVFWKKVLEGYSESKTETSHKSYKYREYVEAGQHIYKITETSKITIVVNPDNIPLYTHANMPDGEYNIKVWFEDVNLQDIDHTYSILGNLKGIETMDSLKVTVVGSMFDDLNN